MTRARRHVVIFAKAPRLGQVKRRLAADIGAVPALVFYRRTLRDVTLRLAKDRRWQCWLAVTPDQAVHMRRVWPSRLPRLGQGIGDLGERMARCFQGLPPGPAVIVGSDIPGLRARHVALAFGALGNHDAVFGPAADGGYWLVGLRRRPRGVDPFGAVRWSSAHALADTLAGLPRSFRVAFLETLVDVDDGAALNSVRRSRS